MDVAQEGKLFREESLAKDRFPPSLDAPLIKRLPIDSDKHYSILLLVTTVFHKDSSCQKKPQPPLKFTA